jgi:hypothetical protein
MEAQQVEQLGTYVGMVGYHQSIQEDQLGFTCSADTCNMS